MIFENKRILFLDQEHIESTKDVTLTLNPPEKRGASLYVEKPWEIRFARPNSIVPWEGIYRLYYELRPARGRDFIAMATSKDGINWERPELGIVSFENSKANNLVDTGENRTRGICVFVDPGAAEEHRFKLIGHNPHEGMFMLTSPDGLRFQRVVDCLLPFNTDSLVSAFFDERVGKYRVYFRAWDRDRPVGNIPGSRVVALAEVDTLFEPVPLRDNAPDPWPIRPPKKVFGDTEISVMPRMNKEVLPYVIACDEHDPECADIYQSAALRYCPGVYLAFPTLYYHYPGPPEGFINDGLHDAQFATSQDGVHWQRDYRQAYVPMDLPREHRIKTLHTCNGMVPNGHFLHQYYWGRQRTHGEGRTAQNPKSARTNMLGDPFFFRVQQRLDGFVSADSAYTGGVLVTKAFEIQSPQINLNFINSASGAAHAALLDENDQEIPGFGLEASDLIQGNETHYPLSWEAQSDVSKLMGKPVKLLVKSRGTKLFAVYP